MLYEHYEKEVVILIDEYDSMVTHAVGKGYEKSLCEFLSGFFGGVFKGNEQVEFAVLTGCLKIAKESIFTGVNNLVVSSVTSNRYSKMFGLTEDEVTKVLSDFGISDKWDSFQEWYNGYLFSDKRIYNTSSVLCYCKDLLSDRTTTPQNYWVNTSSNSILLDIINKADSTSALAELETLVFGGTVSFTLNSDITIDDFNSLSAMWSVLVHSGYLTSCDCGGYFRIPNKEIKDVFVKTVLKWVKGRVDDKSQNAVVNSIWKSDTDTLQKTLSDIFMSKMSFHDSQEYAYHMFLLGLMADAEVKSNDETGNGRSDIILVNKNLGCAILELKKSHAELYMLADALRGIMQIRDKRYGKDFELRGFNVIHYGISFCKKSCCVILESNIDEVLIETAIDDMEAAAWAINWKINKKQRLKASRSKKKLIPIPPPVKAPDSEPWFPERKRALEVFQDVLDHENSNFNFTLLLETTTKLLNDLKWLLKTEENRSESQTLLDALLLAND
jgi:hypothetical protein